MNTKRIYQVAFGLTIAACMTGCQDDKTSSPTDAGKDAIEVGRGPEVSMDGLPSDPKPPSDVAPPLDSGLDTMPAQDTRALDGEPAKDGGLDGAGPTLDVSADKAPPDVPDDVAQGDLPLDSGKISEAGVDLGPVCSDGTKQACASPDNPLIGACHAGTRVCSGGQWGPCSEVLPAASEACNGIDDNCNGMIDEGCAAGCTVVCEKCAAASDDPSVATGSVDHPFASVEAAIKATNPADGGTAQRRICLVGGATCTESWTYQMSSTLKMPDGLILQGAYAITDSGLQYCPGANKRPRTSLRFLANEGVVFDESVSAGAELSSLFIELNPPSAAGSAATTVTAIAIKGGKNVTLSRVFVGEGFAATNTVGLAISSGQATVAGSSISTGQGKSSAVGVLASGGTVNLRNNCDRIVGGTCASFCDDGGSMLGMHGFLGSSTADAPVQSSAVLVTGSASVSLIGNMICGGYTSMADAQSAVTVAALRCEGAGCTTVSGNVVKGGTDRESLAVTLSNASPLVDNNQIEGGCGSNSTTAVRLEGSSARLQNNRILSGLCAGATTKVFRGLNIVSSGTSASPDVHSNNIEPLGLSADCRSIGVLVELATDATSATAGVLRNNIISAGVCSNRVAISEAAGATLQSLRNNDLYAPTSELATTTLVLYHHGSTDATTAAQVNAIGLGTGNISADPQYVSYPREMHLNPQSPCVDQGTSDNAPASDADGNARPAGAGYDIGAYELVM